MQQTVRRHTRQVSLALVQAGCCPELHLAHPASTESSMTQKQTNWHSMKLTSAFKALPSASCNHHMIGLIQVTQPIVKRILTLWGAADMADMGTYMSSMDIQ